MYGGWSGYDYGPSEWDIQCAQAHRDAEAWRTAFHRHPVGSKEAHAAWVAFWQVVARARRDGLMLPSPTPELQARSARGWRNDAAVPFDDVRCVLTGLKNIYRAEDQQRRLPI